MISSKNQWTFNIIATFAAMMFDPVLPVGTEIIEPQAIGFQVDNLHQAGFQRDELGWIDLAFEHGILNALAVVETGFGGPAQAGFACGVNGGNIVRDEDIHGC